MNLEPSQILLVMIIVLQVWGLATDQPSVYHVRLAFFSIGLTAYYGMRYWLWKRALRRMMKQMEDDIAAYQRLVAPAREEEGHE